MEEVIELITETLPHRPGTLVYIYLGSGPGAPLFPCTVWDHTNPRMVLSVLGRVEDGR